MMSSTSACAPITVSVPGTAPLEVRLPMGGARVTIPMARAEAMRPSMDVNPGANMHQRVFASHSTSILAIDAMPQELALTPATSARRTIAHVHTITRHSSKVGSHHAIPVAKRQAKQEWRLLHSHPHPRQRPPWMSPRYKWPGLWPLKQG
ncbi:hypothetical protein H257_16811 [Aphanomyces astaci]|uniref:Uncharacterized protein n=1 Tax=Aphanomyces astaci TaxID=112090 RepID=W4FJ68_APHAT|nr:hypothetical protein H257_16811 [Aphanomyces astaci]ETV66881.1 hypothetical protein H257_16811 [Aphanomyces astaci]|eukprot:XP_009843684.1 hypothetical protein H257_16811 [Aphanomyces astaci]